MYMDVVTLCRNKNPVFAIMAECNLCALRGISVGSWHPIGRAVYCYGTTLEPTFRHPAQVTLVESFGAIGSTQASLGCSSFRLVDGRLEALCIVQIDPFLFHGLDPCSKKMGGVRTCGQDIAHPHGFSSRLYHHADPARRLSS